MLVDAMASSSMASTTTSRAGYEAGGVVFDAWEVEELEDLA
ncbi:MAG TPA: hypothetical protein VHP57_07630 [Acidimicrobiia bacterium]|nr:hypothetical protein [Acidimicrobiia bacterium]